MGALVLLTLLVFPVLRAQEEAPAPAAALAAEIRTAGLDAQECYRVRDLQLVKEDLRFYFTDGHLIFGQPVRGRRITALFVANVEGGDAELLVMPPTRGERRSLAAFTKSPNMDEHFQAALMVFTDDTADRLRSTLLAAAEPRKSAEVGLLLASDWNPVVSNLSESFIIRLVQHLLSGVPAERGFFYAGLRGKLLGNFDVLYDPEAREHIHIGQVTRRDESAFFDTWTSFPARSFRQGERQLLKPDFRMDNFRTNAKLDDNLRLTVNTTATVAVHKDGLRVLAFDISAGMRVTAARINGEECEVFARESLRANLIRHSASSLFLVVPPQALSAGRHYEIEFDHEGDVVSKAGSQVYYVGARANWYPKAGLDFARHDLTFTYPARLSLVFPGDVREETTEGEWRTTRRTTPAPIRVAGFNLGEYERVRVSRGGLSVEVYANRQAEEALQPRPREVVVVPPPSVIWPRPPARRPEVLVVPVPQAPPDPTAKLRPMADEISASYEFLAARLGPPTLPTLMVSPVPGAFGQGFPGLVYLSTLSYLSPQDRPRTPGNAHQQLFFSEILVAHEVAHQWWGNLVTSASQRDDWLMEALANYSALLLWERRKGAKAMYSLLDQYRANLLRKTEEGKTLESAGPIDWGTRLRSSLSPNAWRTIVYEKGTWIVHMLRRRMGDENFFKFLGELCRRYRYQPVSSEDFRLLAAGFLPPGSKDPKLEAFFEHWVHGVGIPTLSLSQSLKGKAPRYRLILTLAQSGVGDEVSVLAPVEIQLSRGRTQTHWMATDAAGATLTLDLRERPLKVQLDPNYSVLTTAN